MKSSLTLRVLALAGFAIFHPQGASADVRLPAIFSDHAVLLSGAEVPVWGWADAGEKVEVSIAGQTKSATPGADGKWAVTLNPLKSGGPHELTVKGKNAVAVKDVLIGEVWLGSGQSNMAYLVVTSSTAQQAKATADLPNIRMFTVASTAAAKAQDDCKGEWVVCSPNTVGRFSAVLYFCGREIQKALGVPIGLIHSSVGGTPIESWISPEAQEASAELKPFFEVMAAARKGAGANEAVAQTRCAKDLAQWEEDAKKARAEKKPLRRKPQNPTDFQTRKGDVGGLFNGKIAPLIPYAIRGALWYKARRTPARRRLHFTNTNSRCS